MNYAEGTPFAGVVGRTSADSVSAWPIPRRPRRGAPNVVVVLLDDVGFAELGCYGSSVRTPVIDQLAANGLRYRRFHTTAVCTSSRASLLTGRNHHAVAAGTIPEAARGFPGYNIAISREHGFLSEMLRREGYATFALGKWHLTPYHEVAVGSSHTRWPLGRGFDRFYGFLGGLTSQWVPSLVYDNHAVEPPRTPAQGYHLNVDLADRAIEFVSDLRAVDPDQPFFLYLCPGAGHSPHHVPREWADRYAGQFDAGWDRLREEVFARQLATGIVPEGTTLSSRSDWIMAWEDLPPAERRLYARQMEVFAGFLEHTDHHLGRVVAFLERIGELDATLLLVVSDNGASSLGGPHGRNGLVTDLEANLESLDDWGGPSTNPLYSWGWAWAGNTPLRRWKRYVHEGGISDPLIIHWPNRIAARGEIRDQYAHITDVAPTILDALAIEAPEEIGGVRQRPIHGVSFAHTFEDPDATTHKHVQYYEMTGSRAIWVDGWKAVTAQVHDVVLDEEDLAAQRWELYDTSGDFSECHDLAGDHPAKVRELVERWWTEAGKYDVLPLDARRRIPQTWSDRRRYVYYPGAAPVPGTLAADLTNRWHQITAQVAGSHTDVEGVVVAHGGGAYGGYALYVKDRRLHYVHSHPGVGEQLVSATEGLGADVTTLGVEFSPTGGHGGTAVLFVDGREVGRGSIARTMPEMFGRCNEGFCCGYDSGQAVSSDYDAPFRFTGTITCVVVEVAETEHARR